MRIDLLSANDPRTTVTAPLRTLWRVGAILDAVAIRDVTTGELWLQMGNNQRLPARLASGHSGGPLNGEQLQLRVLRETPVLALEAIDNGGGSQITEEALRRFLPRQASPTALLANLGWLARHQDELQSLPPAVQRALSNLWQALPTTASLQDPEQLAQALLRSGTFLEAQLTKLPQGRHANADSPIATQDFKAALLQLREQLRGLRLDAALQPPSPGPMPALHAPLTAMATGPASLSVLDGIAPQLSELKQQTDGSLARVTTNQLLHDSAAQQGLLSWLIELPVKNEDRAELLRFKFEREPRDPAAGADSWTVEVALELVNQGPLHVQVSLRGKRLNVQLRSESPALVTALSQQLESLKEGLRAQGLELDRVVCLHGNPVDNGSSRLTRLLDIRA
jgi:hypothetical protein